MHVVFESISEFDARLLVYRSGKGNEAGVVRKHLAHIMHLLRSKGMGDDEKRRYFEKATTIFDTFTAVLTDISSEDSDDVEDGNGQLDSSKSKFNKDKAIWQERLITHGILKQCLEYIQSNSANVMKAAFRLLVAILEGGSEAVHSEASREIDTTSGRRALKRLRDELETSLREVRDSFDKIQKHLSETADANATVQQDPTVPDAKVKGGDFLEKTANLQLLEIKGLLSKIVGTKAKSEAINQGANEKSSLLKLASTNDNTEVHFDEPMYQWCSSLVTGIGMLFVFSLILMILILSICFKNSRQSPPLQRPAGNIVERGHPGLRNAFREQSRNGINFVPILSQAFKILPKARIYILVHFFCCFFLERVHSSRPFYPRRWRVSVCNYHAHIMPRPQVQDTIRS